LAINGGAGSVWQFGLSASGPLLMATSGHFLEETTGQMSLRSTIWSPASIVLVICFPIVVIIIGRLLMPRRVQPISQFPSARKLVEPAGAAPGKAGQMGEGEGKINYADRIERAGLIPLILCAALAVWLYHHFWVEQASLDLNSLNTIFLLACFLLHGNIRQFSLALQRAVVASWPILVLYHLYAGVAGLIQFTTVGAAFTNVVAPISNRWTFPFLTAVAGTVVAIFVPSSGGQWVIQGFITVNAAQAVGVTAQRGMLALGVGDQMGNLISPFWFVVRAEIARIDFRTFFGYGLIFAALWFICGVLAFTFLPC
jgi:short-chain fatty acids transporter